MSRVGALLLFPGSLVIARAALYRTPADPLCDIEDTRVRRIAHNNYPVSHGANYPNRIAVLELAFVMKTKLGGPRYAETCVRMGRIQRGRWFSRIAIPPNGETFAIKSTAFTPYCNRPANSKTGVCKF